MEAFESIEKVDIISVADPTLIFSLETLRMYKSEENNFITIELRHTKSNLINIDGEICKPKRIEVWPSGKCRLWYSHSKGKSFSQICWPMEIKFFKSLT